MASGKVGGRGWLHSCACPLAFAGQLWHRVIINREPASRVARDLGMEKSQADGVIRLLKHVGRVPSTERLAVAAMRVPDVTDEDIAEWFDRPLDWATRVREMAPTLRKREPIDDRFEFLDDGYQPGDPSPAEIASITSRMPKTPETQPRVRLRFYQWSGSGYASVQAGPR